MAKKKVAKKKAHTVYGKVKSYTRKPKVKAHDRRVAGIDGITGTPFTVKTLRKIFPKDMMGYREKSILNAPGVKLKWIQTGVYKLTDNKNGVYMLFCYKHPHHKDFSVIG